jgi:hypothetical protein
MPIRTASMTRKIAANGQALHRAVMRRTESGGADKKPSEAEAALLEERKQLKEEREKRKAEARHKVTALDRLVRTHHPEAKAKPKAKKDGHDEVKKPKARRSRAEKHAEQAAAIEAARHSHKTAAPKKPAK